MRLLLALVLPVLLAAAAASPARAQAKAPVEVGPVPWEVDLTVDPGTGRVEGLARLTLRDLGPDAPVLRLSPGLTVASVAIDGAQARFRAVDLAGERKIEFLHDERLPGEHVFEIRYAGVPGGMWTPDGAWWLTPDDGWHPRLDRAGAEGVWRVTVAAPAGFETVTEPGAAPLAGLHLFVAPFERITPASPASEPVALSALVPRDGTTGAAAPVAGALAAVSAALERLTARFGAYPYPALTLIHGDPTGDGFPGAVTVDLVDPAASRATERAIRAAILRDWWGHALRPLPTEGDWAEGLRAHLVQQDEGYRLALLREVDGAAADVTLARASRDLDEPERAVARAKAALVFHMLERRLGTRRFDAALRALTESRLHRTTGWGNLYRAFSREAGEDLVWFFHQWVNETGRPTLALDEVEVVGAPVGPDGEPGRGFEIRGFLLQSEPAKRLRVPIEVDLGGRALRLSVETDRGRAPFRLDVPSVPVLLEVDPRFDVLRRLTSEEKSFGGPVSDPEGGPGRGSPLRHRFPGNR